MRNRAHVYCSTILRCGSKHVVAELEAAWGALHEATPAGWYVDRPSEHPERGYWVQCAFDPSERGVAGRHKREWEAVAPTEEPVVREMARCLAEISAGRVPK